MYLLGVIIKHKDYDTLQMTRTGLTESILNYNILNRMTETKYY